MHFLSPAASGAQGRAPGQAVPGGADFHATAHPSSAKPDVSLFYCHCLVPERLNHSRKRRILLCLGSRPGAEAWKAKMGESWGELQPHILDWGRESTRQHGPMAGAPQHPTPHFCATGRLHCGLLRPERGIDKTREQQQFHARQNLIS